VKKLGRTKEYTTTKDFFGIPGTDYKETTIYDSSSGEVLGKGVGYTVEESRREAIRDMAYRGRK
jgi:hypothetical protein